MLQVQRIQIIYLLKATKPISPQAVTEMTLLSEEQNLTISSEIPELTELQQMTAMT